MKSAVRHARELRFSAGGIRLKSLWPFQDRLFKRRAKYLVVELNVDGQLVREVERSSGGGDIHFIGRCGELPTVSELIDAVEGLRLGRPLESREWERRAW
jgi:2-oxoglutarate ferredoxin oxidoreductase subunit alpha